LWNGDGKSLGKGLLVLRDTEGRELLDYKTSMIMYYTPASFGGATRSCSSLTHSSQLGPRDREFFIDNLLVRIHFIIVMIRWTGLAPWLSR